MIAKLFGGLIPTVTLQGLPATVESIEFRTDDAEITVRLSDGRAVSVTVDIKNLKLKEG